MVMSGMLTPLSPPGTPAMHELLYITQYSTENDTDKTSLSFLVLSTRTEAAALFFLHHA